MKQVFPAILTVAALALSSTASATPGHDHGVWTSAFVHAAWVLPLIAVAIFSSKSVRAYFKGDK